MTARLVQAALKRFGFRHLSSGSGGHEVWVNEERKRVRPAFRKKEVNEGSLFSTIETLEGLGICTREEFRRAVKGYDKREEAA